MTVRPLQQTTEVPYGYEGVPMTTSGNSSCGSSMYDEDLQALAKGCSKYSGASITDCIHSPMVAVTEDRLAESQSAHGPPPAPTTQEMGNSAEGSHMAFSLNSSIESTDELSAGEQALLDECINAGKPKSKWKTKQSNSKKKCGIPVFRGSWTRSQDSESLRSSMSDVQEGDRIEHADCQSSNEEQEEKGKEDERARENLKKGESISSWSGSEDFSKENSTAGTPLDTVVLAEESPQSFPSVAEGKEDMYRDEEDEKDGDNDDMLLVVTLSKEEGEDPEVVLRHHEPMSESLQILGEARQLAKEVEAEAEDMTESSMSCFSDLENVKAPSMMGDLLSLSMASTNSVSEIEIGATWRKTKDGKRVAVPETVRRALAGNRDAMKSSFNSEMIGSLENLSLKGSLTFELLENINPPSAMDQITRTGSCASLNSISSEILEGKSQSVEEKSQNFKTSGGSVEMYDRLNAAAAMVQVYSRELSSIMNGGNGTGHRSSSTSDNVIDCVHPPTVFKDIAEVTVRDELDVVTDSLASDTEMVEDLPRDDETEGISSDTLMAPYLMSLAKDEQIDGSTENVSTLVEDEPSPTVQRKFLLSKMEITPEEFQTLQDDANLLVSTLHKMGKQDDSRTQSSGSIDKLLDDETLSLISNESDGEQSEHSSPKQNNRPRIIKPINKDSIRQLKEKTVLDVKTSPTISRIAIPKSKDSVKVVRPTLSSGRSAPNSKKPPPFSCPATSPKHSETNLKSPSSLTASKTLSPKFNSNTYTKSKGKASTSNAPSVPDSPTPSTDENRPKLIKQGTFTKDSPTHSPSKSSKDGSPVTENKPLALSSTSMPDRRMSYGGTSSSNVQNVSSQMKRNLSGANLKKEVAGNGMRNSTSSRSLTRQDEGVSRGRSASAAKRSPSSSSLGSPCESGLTGSNVSLSSNSSMGTGATRKNSSNKKEVSSKIASIWKKQEATKQSRVSPENADSRGKPVVPIVKSKIAKPVTSATARSKLGMLGRKNSSS